MPPPAAQAQRTEAQALEYLRVRGYYSTPYTEIVRPERVFAISHYFRRYWLPLLKPGPAWLVVGLRQRCFWNHQQDWCIVSRERLATECGISARTLDKYLDLPLVASWFLLEKVQRYRQMPDGQKQRDWKRYHVRLDEPLTPPHQAALTILARELLARCQTTTPLAQALEVAEGLLALNARELWERLHAGEQQAALTGTRPCSPRGIVEAVCRVEPTQRPDQAEKETRLALNRACDALYVRIVRPNKRQVASQYFRLNWLPVLGATRAWLIMVLRAYCYWNEDELVVRDTCTVPGGYQALAASLGVSVGAIKTAIKSPPGPTFLTKAAIRRPGRGQVEMDFQVEMVEPVTPADQERYNALATDQKTFSAGSPADQKTNSAGSPPDQKTNSAGSPPDQKTNSAGIWEPTKRHFLRNTKEHIRTQTSGENQQQQKEHLAAAVPSLDLVQANAFDRLLQIGFQPSSAAHRYAVAHAPDQVQAWCDYALAEGLGAGYVRAMLDAGELAPPVEKEPEQLALVDADQVERPPSARGVTMQKYGIAPGTMALWEKVLGELQLQMTKATFDVWLRGSLLLSVTGDSASKQKAVIAVQRAQAVDWLQNRLGKIIRRTLARHLDIEVEQLELSFEVLCRENDSHSQ